MSIFWQITLVVEDDLPSNLHPLTKALIEDGFRINPLPQLLKLHDVEACKLTDSAEGATK